MLGDSSDNGTPELRAIYRLLARTRTQAAQGASAEEMARILDDAQGLVGMLLTPGLPQENRVQDRVQEMTAYLREIEDCYAGFAGVTQAYEEETTTGRGSSQVSVKA